MWWWWGGGGVRGRKMDSVPTQQLGSDSQPPQGCYNMGSYMGSIRMNDNDIRISEQMPTAVQQFRCIDAQAVLC
jgi:hypothetical protein